MLELELGRLRLFERILLEATWAPLKVDVVGRQRRRLGCRLHERCSSTLRLGRVGARLLPLALLLALVVSLLATALLLDGRLLRCDKGRVLPCTVVLLLLLRWLLPLARWRLTVSHRVKVVARGNLGWELSALEGSRGGISLSSAWRAVRITGSLACNLKCIPICPAFSKPCSAVLGARWASAPTFDATAGKQRPRTEQYRGFDS